MFTLRKLGLAFMLVAGALAIHLRPESAARAQGLGGKDFPGILTLRQQDAIYNAWLKIRLLRIQSSAQPFLTRGKRHSS